MTNFLPKRISIWPDLVDLFENVTAVRFFGPPCTYTVYHYIYIYIDRLYRTCCEDRRVITCYIVCHKLNQRSFLEVQYTE